MQTITNKYTVPMLIAGMLLLSACGTTPATRFYTLDAEATEIAREKTDARVIIGIDPVEVAPYLERSQIITRTGQTRLKLAEYDRWAEPIESTITNVLAVNLSRLQPSIQPIIRPWADAGVEYHVRVKVSRFDSDAEGNVQLNASWGIQHSSTRDMPVIRKATITQPSAGTDYEAIVKSMSIALAVLSEQIAVELRREIERPASGK